MKAFGLTGNIGCGKSTVAALLAERPDVVILDCDRIAKEVISDRADRREVAHVLDADVFESGEPDFRAIASIIFGDPKKKHLFEQLIHPLVWTVVRARVEAVPDRHICVVESAILYEAGGDSEFPGVIVAVCDAAEQYRRLQANRGMSRSQIDERLAHQISSAEKEARAQFVIHTDCSREQLRGRVTSLYHDLKQSKGVRS